MDTRETITLDEAAQRRLTILTHLMADDLTLEEAAVLLDLSTRQVRRLVMRLRSEGASALVHGNRERPPANRIDETQRSRLLKLARETYAGFNPVHMAETIAEEHPDVAVSARSLRRILAADGIAPARTRRPPRHRSRRERKPRAGMLLQADGSKHDWLEGRGPELTLIGGIDDAIGEFSGAVFRAQEDAAGYFEILAQTARGPGLPLALYTDRHGIFVTEPGRVPTLREQLHGQEPKTQVGRALEALGVRWIPASSPQAKGRSERAWGTLQDRLVSELRRAGASTIEEANVVLARYLPRFNERFGVPARIAEPAWQAWPSPFPLEAELCFHYRRTVSRDATIAWDGTALDVPKRRDRRSWAGREVTVEEHLDGSLWVRDDDERHRLSEAPPVAPLLRARKISRAGPVEAPSERPVTDAPRPPGAATRTKRGSHKPAADHPWRRYRGPDKR
ncbi:MAG: ISNCY family transposase [Chloroflexota bacterium]|nr:ISNCY family transposase [Chloroflexota bacterium]